MKLPEEMELTRGGEEEEERPCEPEGARKKREKILKLRKERACLRKYRYVRLKKKKGKVKHR